MKITARKFTRQQDARTCVTLNQRAKAKQMLGKFRPGRKAAPLNTSWRDTVEQSSNPTLGEVTYSFSLLCSARSVEFRAESVATCP